MQTIEVIIRNRTTQFQCDAETQALLKPFFRYRPPGFQFSPKFKAWKLAMEQQTIDPDEYNSGLWDGWVGFHRYKAVPTGLFLTEQSKLEEHFHLQISDLRERPKFRSLDDMHMKRARPSQLECLKSMIGASDVGGLVISATGSGKTYSVGLYFSCLDGSAVFIVDEKTLMHQALMELRSILGDEEVGEVGMGLFNPKRITVATMQTLSRHQDQKDFQKWFNSLDAIVIDEIHQAVNRSNIGIVKDVKPSAVFGLTATLELNKEHIRMPVVALSGPMIFDYSLEQSTEDGHTTKGKIVAVEIHQVGNAFDSPQTSYEHLIVRSRKRNDCIEAITREALRLKKTTVVLTERRRHLRILSARIKDLPHQVLSGEYSQETRVNAKDKMNAKTLPLILASRVFYKGIDIKTIDCIIDATGRPGRNAAIQRYGRGVRKAEGKEELLYIDISDAGDRNPMTAMTHSRHAAFREIKVPITRVVWSGDARKIFNA